MNNCNYAAKLQVKNQTKRCQNLPSRDLWIN